MSTCKTGYPGIYIYTYHTLSCAVTICNSVNIIGCAMSFSLLQKTRTRLVVFMWIAFSVSECGPTKITPLQ